MGIVRDTYQRCLQVRQILRTHLVKFVERDVFMSREVQKEIRERLGADAISVPQLFVEGNLIGVGIRCVVRPYSRAGATRAYGLTRSRNVQRSLAGVFTSDDGPSFVTIRDIHVTPRAAYRTNSKIRDRSRPSARLRDVPPYECIRFTLRRRAGFERTIRRDTYFRHFRRTLGPEI